MSPRVFSRRNALAALAAIPATASLAKLLRANDSSPSPKRLVLIMQNNGTQQANFWPDASLSSPILDSLFLDASGKDNGLRAKTTLVKGVYIPWDQNGTSANEHDMGFARMFTGEKLLSIGGQPWGGGASVDQILANDWGVHALTLAVLASQTEPYPKPGYDHRWSFSYQGPGTTVHPSVDPLAVYGQLFPKPGGPAVAQRLKLRQSVLDTAAANLSEVSARLGAAERTKLDYHLTAIRSVEHSLAAAKAGVCALQPPAPPDFLTRDPAAETTIDTYIPDLVNNMVDLAAAALGCGATRIATLQLGFCGGKWRFGWKGIDLECHGEVCHVDGPTDAGGPPENTRRCVLMNQYYASCVARLATQLDAMPEGDGTVLDNTLLVWANEFGRGNHSLENVPIVLIGKASGALSKGGRVVDEGRQVFNRVGCSILNLMGKESPGFGDVPDCGVFDGLV